VVFADVVEQRSHWNGDRSFVLTENRLAVRQGLKGAKSERELIVTTMGGVIDDETSVLVVGGPRLVLGKSYVLFLNRENLPGAPGSLTVRDHCQGVFDVIESVTGARAVSQANEHHLFPDMGIAEPAGGAQGYLLNEIFEQVTKLNREVAP